ncbi:MAG: ABC transporter substrate-binding protein [Alphaproteobacteria bacterium]|nr:ABC transporter substrate-binding protein [Alphaproteobacteria bacterium]
MLRHPSKAIALAASIALGIPFAAVAETPRDTLVIAWNIDNLYTFDPAGIGETTTDEIMNNVCDPLILTSYESATKLEPGIARSWSIGEDGMTWTFKMRQGLTHPSGNPVTVKDVEWSLRRVVLLNLNSANLITKWGITKDNVMQAIRATDDETLVVTFDKPYAQSIVGPYMFAGRAAFVLDSVEAKKHEKDGDHANKWLAANTACVGAYRLRSWQANETIILERNDNYWRGQPKMRRVIVRHVPESGPERLQLEKGDIDMGRVLNASDLAGIEANPNTRILRTPRTQFYYVSFNMQDPILSKPKVRQAIKYLVDYEGLEKTVMKYEGRTRQTLVPIGAFGALSVEDGKPFKLDLEKAKQLIAEAGHPNGFEKEFAIGNAFPYPDLAQHIQANAAKIGIKLNIVQMAYGQVIQKHRARNFEMVMSAYYITIPDAHGFVEQMAYNPDNRLEAKHVQYPSWRVSFFDQWFNDMTDKALLERDQGKREALYHEIQKRHMLEGPFAYLFQTFRVMGLNKSIKEIKVNEDRVWYATVTK